MGWQILVLISNVSCGWIFFIVNAQLCALIKLLGSKQGYYPTENIKQTKRRERKVASCLCFLTCGEKAYQNVVLLKVVHSIECMIFQIYLLFKFNFRK
jgi:hypothetical protein